MAAITFKILFEDNHLLVLVKPAGLLSQEDKTGDPDILTLSKSYIKKKYNKPGNVFLGLVHRLDRPASGIMALARTSKAASRLSAQFRDNTVKKYYLCFVEGKLEGSGHKIDYIIKKDQIVSIVGSETAGAKESRLNWQSLWHDERMSLIKVELLTGRPHQIRIQMADLGYPIIGDLRYGDSREFDGKNIALHCFYLKFNHPVLKTPVSWMHLPDHWPQNYVDILNQPVQKELII